MLLCYNKRGTVVPLSLRVKEYNCLHDLNVSPLGYPLLYWG